MDAGILLPAVMQWEAEEYGLYTLEVFINGSRQRTVAIYIRDAAELQAGQEGEAEPETG